MKCSEVREFLSSYADGELSQAEAESVEKHLAQCEECRKVLKDYRQISREISRLKTVPEGTDITARIMTKVKSTRPGKWQFPTWQMVGAGMVLIALVIGLVLGAPMIGEKPDHRALAAKIVENSPEVSTALGTKQIRIVKVHLTDGRGLVICGAGMKQLIAVRLNLEAKTVEEINSVTMPELSQEQKTNAIAVARENVEVQSYLGGSSGLNIKVFPFYDITSLETETGEIYTRLPDPNMAMVEIEAGNKRELLQAIIDLDKKTVTTASRTSPMKAPPPSVAPMSKAEIAEVMKFVVGKTEVKELLDKGAVIDRGTWKGTGNIGYVTGEDGQMTTVAVVSKDKAMLTLKLDEKVWEVEVVMETKEVSVNIEQSVDTDVNIHESSKIVPRTRN